MLVFLVGIALSIALFGLAELIRRQGPAQVEPGGRRSIRSTVLFVSGVLVLTVAILSLFFHSFVSSFVHFPFRLFHTWFGR